MLRKREVAMLENLHDAPDAQPLQEKKETPRLMVGATAGMVVVSIALTIFAGPLYAYSTRAGHQLAEPGELVEQVLGERENELGGGSGVTRPDQPAEGHRMETETGEEGAP